MLLTRSILLCLALLISVLATACRRTALASTVAQRYVGRTVGDYMEATDTRFQEIVFLDEPPGRLRDLLISRSAGGSTNVVLIRIEVLWSDPPFSRSWKEGVVRAARIRGIQVNPKSLVE